MFARPPRPPLPPESEPPGPKGPKFQPLLSRRPGASPLSSLLPFVASLRPGSRESVRLSPNAPPSPVINFLPESESSRAPTVPEERSAAPGRAQRSIPVPGEAAAPDYKGWRRSLTRVAVLPAVALAVAGAAFLASKGDGLFRSSQPTRSVGTPGLKQTSKGEHVRWQTDAIEVVLDRSFTDLAGPKVYGAAVDAWRATGATLPSISTKSGKSRELGYKSKGDNENVVVYAPTGFSRANGALAITVLTYEEESGRVVDADVLLNGGGRYFALFDRDESSGDPVSIDGSGTAVSGSSTATPSKTAKFDVQSVVTHELGHFFGLGEDYEDAKATMYISTRHGEIHKRIITKNEGAVMTALYTDDVPGVGDPAEARGGCGRAQLARTGSPSSNWIGFVVAGLGLGLYTAARRARATEQRALVRAGRAAPARRLRRIGAWLTTAGLVTSLAPPTVEAATDQAFSRGDAEVEIVKSEPRWVDGLVETELTYRVTTCHVAHCPEGDQRVVALGGKLDGMVQLVGPFALPQVGARVALGLRDGRGLMQTLRLNLQP
jgi:hypothetical protein